MCSSMPLCYSHSDATCITILYVLTSFTATTYSNASDSNTSVTHKGAKGGYFADGDTRATHTPNILECIYLVF